MPHVWFRRIDLSGTPPQFEDAISRKDWARVKRIAAKDARDHGGLLDEFWIQGSGTNHTGDALVHVPDGWPGSEEESKLRRRWHLDDRDDATEILFTVEEKLDQDEPSEQS